MSYLMTVEISNTEKKKVIDELLADMSADESKKLMLKAARELRYCLSEDEKNKLIKDLTKALITKPPVGYSVPLKDDGQGHPYEDL